MLLVGALALAGAACGDDDDGDDAASEAVSGAAELATGTVNRVVAFDPAARQQSEGVAVTEDGDVFVSWSFLGQVVKIAEGSRRAEPFGSVQLDPMDFGVLGLTVDGDGDVLAAVQSKVSNGVWRFDSSTGQATRLTGSEAIGFPNDVAVDDAGNVYVASSNEGKDPAGANIGAIWRITPSGTAERWLVNAQLGGTGTGGFPVAVGVNGIEYHDDGLYLTNTEKAQVLTLAIGDDGKPGALSVLAQDPKLDGADGVAVDGEGNAFVAVIKQSQIVRVGSDKAVTVVAGDADGLDFTSAVEFGAGESEGTLWAVNFAVGELLGGKTVEGPALLAIPPAD